MPLPLLGFAASGAYSLIAGVTVWLSTYIGKKAAVGAATGAVMVAGWVALQLAAFALWSALGFVTPPYVKDFLKVFWYIAPSNLVPCVTAVIAARIGAWLWRQQRAWFEVVAAS